MKNLWRRKLLSGLLAAAMAATAISGGMAVVSAAKGPSNGTFRENSFEENAPLTMERLSSIQIGVPNPDGAVAEIVT